MPAIWDWMIEIAAAPSISGLSSSIRPVSSKALRFAGSVRTASDVVTRANASSLPPSESGWVPTDRLRYALRIAASSASRGTPSSS